MNRAEIRFSYRNFHMEKGSVIVQTRFGLRREGREDVSERIALYLRRRKQTQPLEYPSAGSVFKNPPDDHAGRLIDEAGLKGTRVGGAMISEKHANFIVNTGGATAEDILDLMRLARDRVKAETGIQLEPEIKIVGE
jgi:UDP-N-acetylmuramate dehydrogenase